MRYPCNLIKDLLPLYHDQVSSQESREAVEEHLKECSECKQYYEKMCGSDAIEPLAYDQEMSMKTAESYKQIKRQNRKKTVIMVLVAVVVAVVELAAFVFVILGLGYLSLKAPIVVHDNIAEYTRYRKGEAADRDYRSKWGMDESIWPERITDDMEVVDYIMVYYNPWDAQYLGYLEVDYDSASYAAEMERLKEYESTDYIGYYGVTGFEDYELLAIYADANRGFVYALTDGEDTIIYVEAIFVNYFMDLDYTEYVPAEYLPEGFDATEDNAYRQEKLGR